MKFEFQTVLTSFTYSAQAWKQNQQNLNSVNLEIIMSQNDQSHSQKINGIINEQSTLLVRWILTFELDFAD